MDKKNIETMNLQDLKIERVKINTQLNELEKRKKHKNVSVLLDRFTLRDFYKNNKKQYRLAFLTSVLALATYVLTIASNNLLIGILCLSLYGADAFLFCNLAKKKKEHRLNNYKRIEEKVNGDELLRSLDFCPRITKKIEKLNKELTLVDNKIVELNKKLEKLSKKQETKTIVKPVGKYGYKKDHRSIRR